MHPNATSICKRRPLVAGRGVGCVVLTNESWKEARYQDVKQRAVGKPAADGGKQPARDGTALVLLHLTSRGELTGRRRGFGVNRSLARRKYAPRRLAREAPVPVTTGRTPYTVGCVRFQNVEALRCDSPTTQWGVPVNSGQHPNG